MTTPPPLPTELLDFLSAHRLTPFELSLLPPSISSTPLISSPHVGLPKSYLLTAFAWACHRFQCLRAATTPNPHSDISATRSLLDTTTILLLIGSENFTAINTRKRILLSSFDKEEKETLWTEELVWLESLLTSPLPKHTKSAVLWRHRRWVLETLTADQEPGRSAATSLEKELGLAQKAGELHPKNYYAWGYVRWVVTFFSSTDEEKKTVLRTHLNWCLSHVSDVSGWAFLGFLMEEWVGTVGEGIVLAIVKEAAIFIHNIAPGHESFWAFLRGVIAGVLQESDGRRMVARMVEEWVETDVREGEEAATEKALEAKALRWIQRFGGRESQE